MNPRKKLEKLTSEKEKGELAKYTKKERLLIDREIANLERFFSGIASMKELPKAIFIVDPKKEKTAVQEADYMGIPVVAISGSDCNIKHIDYPIVGNDSSQTSIQYLTQEITKAYFDAKLEAKKS
jgi:small subunit ribosomal protein S2